MKSYFELILLLCTSLGLFVLYANVSTRVLGENAPFEIVDSLLLMEEHEQRENPAVVDFNESVEPEHLEIVDFVPEDFQGEVDPAEVLDSLSRAEQSEEVAFAEALNDTSMVVPDLNRTVEVASAAGAKTKKSTSAKRSVSKVPAGSSSGEFILLFGDSMVDGLARRLDDYAHFNGHKMMSVLRVSSTTFKWAADEDIVALIQKVKPTLIIVVLGSNELSLKGFKKLDLAVDKLTSKFGSTPYIWIGPPNWKKDSGINDYMLKKIGSNRFFESRNLTFERGPDHIHPTVASCEKWFDSVAEWMRSSRSVSKLKMDTPSGRGPRRNRTQYWQR